MIAKVDALKDSKDFKTTTPLIIQLQKDWKEIGAVDRKHREKIWKQFKAACNHYFNQMDSSRNQESQEYLDNLEKNKPFLTHFPNCWIVKKTWKNSRLLLRNI